MKTHDKLDEENLKKVIRSALRAWHKVDDIKESLLDFLFLVQVQNRLDTLPPNQTDQRLATNQILLEAIEELNEQDHEAAQVIRSRFANKQKIVSVAHQLNVSENTVSRIQRRAITSLAKIIIRQEMEVRRIAC